MKKKETVKHKMNRLRLYFNLVALGIQMITIIKLIRKERHFDK